MKLSQLTKICENDKFVYFYQKNRTKQIWKGEKHKKKIWKLERITFEEFIKYISFLL